MTTKILAVIAEAQTAPACLDAAEAAAHALGDATIEALHIVVDPSAIVSAPEEISFQQLREVYEGSAKERAAAVHRSFERWLWLHPTADIPIHWKELVGSEQKSLSDEAVLFDLLVLAQARNIDGADALHAAIFAIRHPFILVPSNWRLKPGDTFARHVVLAWNGTKGARRAVEGALPWCRVATDVTVLLVGEDAIEIEPLTDILRKGHVVEFRIEHVPRNDGESLGDQIVHEAHKLGADLLVMGAYRHNQIVEWLLGGTTRHVLAHLDLPLLAAH